jgi:beta-phosphoglucomutase
MKSAHRKEIQFDGITMPIRAFIFDLDGVLTDTAEYHYQAWKQLAEEEGIPFDREKNEALRGVSRRESLNLLLGGRMISEEQAFRWMELKNSYYLEKIRKMTPDEVLPGARELLAEIRAAGLKLAIASASKNAREVADRLDLIGAVDVLADGHSVQRTKPAPDLFLHAAEKMGVPPDTCIVVEDAAAGIEAAQGAGMLTIGIGPKERVGKADLVLPNLEGVQIEDLLRKLGGGK